MPLRSPTEAERTYASIPLVVLWYAPLPTLIYVHRLDVHRQANTYFSNFPGGFSLLLMFRIVCHITGI
jgi:hypothetical protein